VRDVTGEPPMITERPFTVLAVCTGNICRSPAVERLLVAALGPDGDLHVASAGVSAVVGAPISPPMASLLAEAGAAADGFIARQLTEQMVRDADLVLALTKGHRSRVVSLHPGAVRRTFTVRELARLAGAVDLAAIPSGSHAARLAALLPLAAAQRGQRIGEPGEDDVVDPYGGDAALYQRSFDELGPAVLEIARIVRG
jgi:protein-tyrosine phosphatase